MRSRPACFLLLLLALVLAPSPGCGSDSLRADPLAPVLVIGLDGLEWSVLHGLLQDGRCPNLRQLIDRGAFGYLGTFKPTSSPVIWTSIATGKDSSQHGITGFVDRARREFTSSRREGRALWNIADMYGLTSHVIGWWITWPVEPIDGVMVSATSASAMLEDNWKPALMEGLERQVHPPELTARVLEIARAAGSREHIRDVAVGRVFGEVAPELLGELERKIIDQTMWSIQSDETYRQIANEVLSGPQADLTMVYFGGTDVAGHRFWRHYQPEKYAYGGTSPEVDAALADVIPNYYEWADDIVGQLLAKVDPDTTVFVVSDHGMHEVATQALHPRYTSGDHQDAAPGVIIAAGPGIARQGGVDLFLRTGAVPTHGSVFAIAPTVLALLGIPPSKEMQFRPYRNFLTPEARQRVALLEPVESHDEGFRPSQMEEVPEEKEGEFLQRMKELGYLDLQLDPEAPTELVDPETYKPDVNATSPGGSGQPAADGDEQAGDG